MRLAAWRATLCLAAGNNADPNGSQTDQIPPLLPPRGEIPPGFWEQYLWHIVAGAMVFFGLLALAAWWWTRPKAEVLVPPAEQARKQLDPLLRDPETGVVLTRVSHIVRGYFGAVFGLPKGELTTGEFSRAVAASDRAIPEVADAAVEFLRACDERKFSPGAPSSPFGAAAEALKLIARAEESYAQPSVIPASAGDTASALQNNQAQQATKP